MGRPPDRALERLQIALAIFPYLFEQRIAQVSDVARRFGIPEAELLAILALLPFCGNAPFGGGDLLDITIEGTTIRAHPTRRWFNRAKRLTPAESMAIIAAGEALLGVPGMDGRALRSALDKLAAALEAHGQIVVNLDRPPLLDVVKQATDQHLRLAITYWSAWRDALTDRSVDPLLLTTEKSRWYLDAFDVEAGMQKRFRVDRILQAEPVGPADDHPVPAAGGGSFTPGDDARRVILELPASAAWVAEAYEPVEVAPLADGRLRVTLDVMGERWLERLLLRVGPEARVIEPADLVDLQSRAAAALLARYEA